MPEGITACRRERHSSFLSDRLLGTVLTDQLALDLVRYAFQFETQQLFLTDGLIWRHYCDFKPGNVQPQRIVSLSKDRIVDSAAYLVQGLDATIFWPERETMDELSQKVNQLESDVATLKKDLAIALQQPPADRFANTERGAVSLAPVINPVLAALPYIELEKISDATGKKPRALRLPDGSLVEVSKWKDVLRECCKFALATSPSIPVPLPDKAGRRVQLLSTTRPPTGINHVVEQYNGQAIFVYTNYDANHCVANAEHILTQVPDSRRRVAAAVSIENG